jgi:hypothetical protein
MQPKRQFIRIEDLFQCPEILTPAERAERVSELDFTGLSARERVAKVLNLFPDLSDRELGKLSGTAAATAKKHREALKADTPG